MALEYTELSRDQKLMMVRQRLLQLEQSHYGFIIDRETTLANQAIPQEQKLAALAEVDAQIAIIEAAHAATLDEKNKILAGNNLDDALADASDNGAHPVETAT